MGIDDEIGNEVPSASPDSDTHDAEQPAGLEIDTVSPELRAFSAEFAAKHGLPKLVEDKKTIDMRTSIVEQARTGADVRDVVIAYAEHLQNHFAQVENLTPGLSMAISQVVQMLLMVALKCEREMYDDAYEDLFGEEFNSVYTFVLGLRDKFSGTKYDGDLARIEELSELIREKVE